MTATKYQQKLIKNSIHMLMRHLPHDATPELQTFCAIAIELMRTSEPEKLRDAARLVEMRHMTKGLR